jgi:hypothetical protein
MTPIALRLKYEVHGEHVHARVFVGEVGATLASAGELAFRKREWFAFAAALQVGAPCVVNGPHVEFERVEGAAAPAEVSRAGLPPLSPASIA